jgi:hypothetical protein
MTQSIHLSLTTTLRHNRLNHTLYKKEQRGGTILMEFCKSHPILFNLVYTCEMLLYVPPTPIGPIREQPNPISY